MAQKIKLTYNFIINHSKYFSVQINVHYGQYESFNIHEILDAQTIETESTQR